MFDPNLPLCIFQLCTAFMVEESFTRSPKVGSLTLQSAATSNGHSAVLFLSCLLSLILSLCHLFFNTTFPQHLYYVVEKMESLSKHTFDQNQTSVSHGFSLNGCFPLKIFGKKPCIQQQSNCSDLYKRCCSSSWQTPITACGPNSGSIYWLYKFWADLQVIQSSSKPTFCPFA